MWIESLKVDVKINDISKVWVCSKHFNETDYFLRQRDGIRQLKRKSVPSICLLSNEIDVLVKVFYNEIDDITVCDPPCMNKIDIPVPVFDHVAEQSFHTISD